MTTMAGHVTAMLTASPDARRVLFGSTVGYGTMRTTDETVDDGSGAAVRRRLVVLTLPTNAIPTLAEGSTVIVYATKLSTSAQTSYIVRDTLAVEDGLLTKYRLVPV